jgi:hypothetical protein
MKRPKLTVKNKTQFFKNFKTQFFKILDFNSEVDISFDEVVGKIANAFHHLKTSSTTNKKMGLYMLAAICLKGAMSLEKLEESESKKNTE